MFESFATKKLLSMATCEATWLQWCFQVVCGKYLNCFSMKLSLDWTGHVHTNFLIHVLLFKSFDATKHFMLFKKSLFDECLVFHICD